jgi:hypothetical protein
VTFSAKSIICGVREQASSPQEKGTTSVSDTKTQSAVSASDLATARCHKFSKVSELENLL